MAAPQTVTMVVDIVEASKYRTQVATEFYGRAAKLVIDGWEWQDALIHVGKDFGLFSNSTESDTRS